MNPSYYNEVGSATEAGIGCKVGDLYMERTDLVAKEALKFRRENGVTDASADRFKVLVLGIDAQMAFCARNGSLYVPGAHEDLQRIIEWIYGNVGRITKFILSLDTHAIHQVFHSAFWADKDGNHPVPFTIITNKDIADGKWTPGLPGQRDFKDLTKAMLDYTAQLEKGGKYALTIWPYHTLLGGAGHIIVPSLMEAVMFHAFARRIDPAFIVKGSNPYTENFSIISPEVTQIADGVIDVTKVGQYNTGLIDTMRAYDRIYVFGQAKSHCVLSTLMSLYAKYGTDKEFMSKIFLLEDAMSAIPAPPVDPLPDALNFPKVTEEAFVMFAKAGMKRVTTKEPKE
jgi:nicotinamidase-related amidase